MNGFDHVSGRFLDVDDALLYYEVQGRRDAPVLLFLHAGFGHIADFNDVIGSLERPWRVVGLDSRGHGRSTLGSTPLSYALLQSDVERLLDHLEIGRASVFGFSDGGVVAYRLALARPHLCERVVTVGARWHVDNTLGSRDKFVASSGATWRAEQPDAYAAYQRLNPDPDFERLTRALVAMWLDADATGYPAQRAFAIDCPTLVVRGDRDPNLTAGAVVELAGRLSRAHLFIVPFAGHAAFVEQHTLFMAGFLHFVAA